MTRGHWAIIIKSGSIGHIYMGTFILLRAEDDIASEERFFDKLGGATLYKRKRTTWEFQRPYYNGYSTERAGTCQELLKYYVNIKPN